MKKMVALMLMLAVLAMGTVGLAEDAAVATSSKIVFSNLYASQTMEGVEKEFDFSGISLTMESIEEAENCALVVTLGGPEGQAAQGTVEVKDGQLVFALDGVSKVFSASLEELMAMLLESIPEGPQKQMLQAALSGEGGEGEEESSINIDAMMSKIMESASMTEISEPVDTEFMDGKVLPATGLALDAGEGLVAMLNDFIAQNSDETDDLYEGDDDVEYQNTEPAPKLASMTLNLLTTEDMQDIRVDALITLDDGSEMPLCILAHLNEDGSGAFAISAEDKALADGNWETPEHAFNLTVNMMAEDEQPITLELNYLETQPEGSEEYDEMLISLTVDDGEAPVLFELYLCDTDAEQSMVFSTTVDEDMFVVGYDGTVKENDEGIAGTAYMSFGDDTDSIFASVDVETTDNLTDVVLPDFSALKTIGLADLETVSEDAELIGEVIAVAGNVLAELAKVPAVAGLFSSEVAE